MKRSVYIFGIVFFFASILFHDKKVFAAETGSGFAINPFYQTIDVKQNQQSVPFSVKVTNDTDSAGIFRVSVLDFGTLDESGGVAFLGASDNLKYGLASWISLSNDTLVLEPGETKAVAGTIENKESLSPGGHYGAVYFKIESDQDGAGGKNDQVAFNPSLASLLFVKKIGGETYGLHLDGENATKNIFLLPKSADLRFQNTGNVHVTPRGDIEIYDPAHRLVSKNIINAGSSIILPETFRMFPVKLEQTAAAFIPGRYTMTIKYRYDGLDIFADSSQTFFLIPPLFILAMVVLLAAIIFAIRFVGKIKK